MKQSCPRWLCLLAFCTTVTGCALGDYEKRIDEQQKRLAILDEENRQLNPDAIEPPRLETKEGKKDYWPFDVFLRLPRGYSVQPTVPGYAFNGQDPQLFLYAGNTGYNFFLAAGLILDEKKKVERDKGVADKDRPRLPEWSVETFRSHVRGALMDYYRKTYHANPGFPLFDLKVLRDYSVQPEADRGPNPPPVKYLAGAFSDNLAASQFEVYFHQWDNRQIAVVVQIPLAAQADAGVRSGLVWSLKSLDISGMAATRRNALQSRNNFRL